MKTLAVLGGLLMAVMVGCSGAEPDSSAVEQEVKACTRLAIYCPPECKQTQGGCPVQCHCPNYTACGPSLRCGVGEVCCTGPGPVSVDPSQNSYSCNPSGSLCPL